MHRGKEGRIHGWGEEGGKKGRWAGGTGGRKEEVREGGRGELSKWVGGEGRRERER